MQEVQETLLSFDFGLSRIGVAVGNTVLKKARALTIITGASSDIKFSKIASLLKEWQVNHCVVGVPYHPDGAAHDMTERCHRFARQLVGRFKVRVSLIDERYSSAVIATKRGQHNDAEAAAIILQHYFDENL